MTTPETAGEPNPMRETLWALAQGVREAIRGDSGPREESIGLIFAVEKLVNKAEEELTARVAEVERDDIQDFTITAKKILETLLDTDAVADDFANQLSPDWFTLAERVEALRDQFEVEVMLREIAERRVKDVERHLAQAQLAATERDKWESIAEYWYWASAYGLVEEPTHWCYQDEPIPPLDLNKEIECFLVLYEPNSPDSRPENICVVFSEEAAKKEVERLETLAKPIRELAHECYLYSEMFYESYDSEDYSKSIYDDQVYSSMRDELNDMIRSFDNSCGVFFTPCCISPVDHEWQPKFCYQKIPILKNEPDCNCHNFEYQVCDICQGVSGEETDES